MYRIVNCLHIHSVKSELTVILWYFQVLNLLKINSDLLNNLYITSVINTEH